ncbi:MAG: response regulator transcription factor [Deltaproteobacteria bacterium]|nr:response regulator transcription factor [Deltaproteobacteria bacterium]
MNIRILLADDHKIMREGLCSLLEKQNEMEVVAQAENGRMTVKLTRELAPDVVIMDVAMPDLNGIEATQQIISEFPSVKVIALSMYSDRQTVKGMLRAGASGYLIKDSAFEELAQGIRAVLANRIYLSTKITDVVVKDYARQVSKDKRSAFSLLTPREREILQLLAEGKSVKQIASSLHLSVNTVNTHRAQVMTKLDLHSIVELTKYAIREGLTSPEI